MTPPATAAVEPTHRSGHPARRVAVRHPRRISGPARVAHSMAAVAIPAPGIAIPGRRQPRPTAPSRPRPARRPARRASHAPVLVRVALALGGVVDSTLLDRIVRGRIWIGLLAFALCGIVAMQLVVLKLNTGIGRALQRAALIQRQDAQIGVEDSLTSAGDRVEPLAAAAGMTVPAPAALHFVGVGPADVSKAAAVLSGAIQAPVTTAEQGGAATGLGASTSSSATTGSTAATTAEAQESTGSSASSSGGAAGLPVSAGESAPTSSVGSEPAPTSSVGSEPAPASTSSGPFTSAPAGSNESTPASAGVSAPAASGPGGGTQAVPQG